MREEEAQQVLAVRAFEETDRDSTLLTARERKDATRKGLEQADSPPNSEVVITLRAGLLLRVLKDRVLPLTGILHLTRFTVWPVAAAAVISLAAGFATNALGFERRINLLSFPLLVLLAWNLGIYLVKLLLLIRRQLSRHLPGNRGTRSATRSDAAGGLIGLLMRGVVWYSSRNRRSSSTGTETQLSVTALAFARYGVLWYRCAGPLLVSRLRRALHVGAIAMIAGVVGGMYIRGFAFEYRATWESTLLDASSVQCLLGVILGPAARLLGVALPDVTPLRGPGADGSAGIWIHLFSVTALLVVVIPRTVFALHAWWQSFWMARSIPVDTEDIYFRGLLTEWRGARMRAQIRPYSFRPDPGTLDALQSLLYDYFGARADIRVHDTLPYGTAADGFLPSSGASSTDQEGECLVILFNMAQSPEVEVHGVLLEQLKKLLEIRGGRLLVVIDATRFLARIDLPERLQERRRAWERIVRELDIRTVEFSSAAASSDAILEEVRSALWPALEPAAGSTASGEL